MVKNKTFRSGLLNAALPVLMLSIASVALAGPKDAPIPVGDGVSLMGVTAGRTINICDNNGYHWTMTVTGRGTASGSVDVGGCTSTVWNATGTFDAVNIGMTATNPTPDDCANWFTYSGTHTGKAGKTASGTWINDGGASGTWSAGLCSAQ